ncbi:hypothetical protein FWF89_02410 [Candidatus Saccharibacteria bacterium]|nr:hypothetical protein [Candidatus Saccharibacteria bacterium]
MFEINLVPDVKEQLLKKQRLRNLIIFISIIVAAGSAALVALLGSIVTGQNIAMSNQDREIKCRSVGPTSPNECTNYGTAVMRFENLNDYLTIQDQMNKISALNDAKLLLSRVFGILDVILPTGDDVVQISELGINLPNATLNFDAQGDSASGIDYRALEVFKNIIRLSYYDYGRYMRYDNESGSFVEIPTTCMDEMVESGIAYGIYHKGAPGCEAPVLSVEQQENMNNGSLTPADEETDNATDGETSQITDIKIRRAYRTLADKEEYQLTDNVDGIRYYFESQCIAYDEEGRINEGETRETCRLSAEAPSIRDSSNGRDSEGNLVLRFSATITLNREVFRFMNKHMRIIGPTRQNVTDSYTQIRDMFTERAAECSPDDEQCRQQVVPNGN